VTLRLHPDLIAAGYDFLRQSAPFKGWRLPEADEIGFGIVEDPTIFADFCLIKGEPLIRVSGMNGHTVTLLGTIAHEMIHLYQHLNKLDIGGGDHNPDFWKRAKRVCAVHGFDPKTF
jgi:hypothetical protein